MLIEGVIIAAGKSSRMGPKHKLTMDLHGQSLIERSVSSMLPSCTRIVVVTGFHREKICAQLQHYPNLALVHNENCGEGMFSSLKVGLGHARGERIFFLPGDCPFVAEGVYEKMLQAEADIVIPAFQGQPGHPVLLSDKAARQVLANEQYHTLKEFIDDNGPKVIEVDCPGVLWDIDTPEDFVSAQKYFDRQEKMS